MPSLLYADDLVLYGEYEEDLNAMMEQFLELRRKIDLKVNASKKKMMVLGGEEGLDCEG